MRRLLLIILLLATAPLAPAQPVEGDKEPIVFQSAEQEQRYKDLTLELRCLVCQNQNLADSDAPLAQQLRGEIFGMLDAGRTDEEIKSFMVDRYGDFVLYRPPMQGNTLALWLMPAAFLFVGGIAVVVAVRKRKLKLAGQRRGEAE
jgi:cytochrome c-type biogenesis protein CcmH